MPPVPALRLVQGSRQTASFSPVRTAIRNQEPQTDRVDGSIAKNEQWIRRIAVRIARRVPRHIELQELVQAGRIGLWNALQRHRPEDGELLNFAKKRVEGAMLDELRKQDPLGRDTRGAVKRMDEATDAVLGKGGGESEVAATLGIDVDELNELRLLKTRAAGLSLEELTGAGFEPSDSTMGTEETEPRDALQTAIHHQEFGRIHRAMQQLTDRQRQVVEMYYLQGLTEREIGDVMGVTESRVCQLVGEGVGRIKEILKAEEESKVAERLQVETGSVKAALAVQEAEDSALEGKWLTRLEIQHEYGLSFSQFWRMQREFQLKRKGLCYCVTPDMHEKLATMMWTKKSDKPVTNFTTIKTPERTESPIAMPSGRIRPNSLVLVADERMTRKQIIRDYGVPLDKFWETVQELQIKKAGKTGADKLFLITPEIQAELIRRYRPDFAASQAGKPG